MAQREPHRVTTYHCPYYRRLKTVQGADILATERCGEKYYVVWHECGTIQLPYAAFLKYRDKYCASEDVNGWRECSLAQALEDYYEHKDKRKK